MQIRCNVCSTTVTIGDDIARALGRRSGTVPCRNCRAAVPVLMDPAWTNAAAGPPRVAASVRTPHTAFASARATSPGIAALAQLDPPPDSAEATPIQPVAERVPIRASAPKPQERTPAEPASLEARPTAREPAASSPRPLPAPTAKGPTPPALPGGPPRSSAVAPQVPRSAATPPAGPSLVRTATMPVAVHPAAGSQPNAPRDGNAAAVAAKPPTGPAIPPARPTAPGVGAPAARTTASGAAVRPPAAPEPLPSAIDQQAAKAASAPTKPGVPAAKAAAQQAAATPSARTPTTAATTAAATPRRTDRSSHRPIPPLPQQKGDKGHATSPVLARSPEGALHATGPAKSPPAARTGLPSRTTTRLGLPVGTLPVDTHPAQEYPKPPSRADLETQQYVEPREHVEPRAAIVPSQIRTVDAAVPSVPDLTSAAELSDDDDEDTIAGSSLNSLLASESTEDDDRPTRRPPAVGELEEGDDSLPTLPPAAVHFRSEPVEELDDGPTSVEPVTEAEIVEDPYPPDRSIQVANAVKPDPPAVPAARSRETRGGPARPPPPPARIPSRTGPQRAMSTPIGAAAHPPEPPAKLAASTQKAPPVVRLLANEETGPHANKPPSIPPLHGPGSISAVAMTSSRAPSANTSVARIIPSVPAPAFPSALAADVNRAQMRRHSGSRVTAVGSAFVAICVIVGAGYFGAISGRPKAVPAKDPVTIDTAAESPPVPPNTATTEQAPQPVPAPPPTQVAPTPRAVPTESSVANREAPKEKPVRAAPQTDEPREKPAPVRKERTPRSPPSEEPATGGTPETRLPDQGEVAKSIDQGALRQAFAEGETKAKSCVGASSPTGVARLSVTFAPSGEAVSAIVLGVPFANTIEGQCISAKFRALHVPAFSGADVIVRKSINFL